MRKLEHDRIAADLASVEKLLSELKPSSFIARMDLESRRDELQAELRTVNATEEPLAKTDLFFSGEPVINNQGIESYFGGNAIAGFQDIVSKLDAAKTAALGERGPVAGRQSTLLHVTGTVRGSFGFHFEELGDPVMFDSTLKDSVEEAAKLMTAFDEPDEDTFSRAIEGIDGRVLDTVKGFFDLVQRNGASFRIVSDTVDHSFDFERVNRAAERARVTTIQEHPLTMRGQLIGVLPEHRTFEFRAEGSIIFGKIDASFPADQVPHMNRELVDRNSVATFRVKEILRPNRPPHLAYFLENIRAGND